MMSNLREDNISQSALIQPPETTLVIIDQHDHVFGSPTEVAWWRGRPYAPIMELALMFDVPQVIYFTLGGCNGSPLPNSVNSLPVNSAIQSTQINPWQDATFTQQIDEVDRPKLLISGYCTQGGVTFAVLDALLRGFDVGYVADASAGLSCDETRLAIDRMIQAGAIPLSWRQIALEWQADWADAATRDRVIKLLNS